MSAFAPANDDKISVNDAGLAKLFPSSKAELETIPQITGNLYLVDGQIKEFTKATEAIATAIYAGEERLQISTFGRCDKEVAMTAVDAASRAWNRGLGSWPQSTIQTRVTALRGFLTDFKEIKNLLAELLMWDICKSRKDAVDEVERTIDYIQDTIDHAIEMYNKESTLQVHSGVAAQIRHLPIGVVLASGPFNYPLNECYTTFIPALMMGNTVILRFPRNGAAAHFPTLELFKKHFPPGVINVLSGSGREIMTPLMESGQINYLAFIGRSTSATALVKKHPEPHRLHTLLQMDSKDCAILLKDADLDVAAEACATGAFSFNGQRCTAIKLVWVHESCATEFVKKFAEKVDALKMGMPWEKGVKITPLCEDNKPDDIKDYIEDALKHGAHILNKNGAKFYKSLAAPTIVGPVNNKMKLWHEEQFGPVSPVAVYKDISEPLDWVTYSQYGLQSAVFGYDTKELARVVDTLALHEGRVNINSPDKRGPDVYPFTGRKNSAMGMTNAQEALKLFSIPTIVATTVKDGRNIEAVEGLIKGNNSVFFNNSYVFPT